MSFVVPSFHNRGVKRNAHGAPAGTAPRRMPVPPVPSPLVNGNNTRKTNGVKEVVKKKKSIHTQQHNDELTKLWTQYIEDSAVIPNLMEELKDNLIIGGATDSKKDVKIRKVMTKEDRIGHWRAIMARITAILERKYDRLVRHDCSSNSDEGSTKINLTFMVNALKEMHGEYPIQPDWVRWAITKLMLLLTGKIVYDKMGMNICDHLLTLLQFLKDDKAETSDLLQTMIGQMHALTQQAKSITFTRATVPPELRAEIQMEWRNGCENVIMLSIVDLLLIHPLFDFPSLPSRIQLQLWASLFHLLNTRSQNAQHSSVQLMQRLLYRDLASLEIVRLVVDYGVAFFKKYPPSKKESEKEVNLRVTIIDIVQLLTDHLRKLGRSKLLKGAQATVLIGWAVSVLGLAETWNLDNVEEEREAGLNGQRNILRTFSLICCRILSSIQVKSATQLKDPLKELVEAVKRVITVSLHEWALPSPAHRVGMTAAAAAAAAEERMACAANFLLFSDDLNGNEENSLWISKETDKTLKACSDRMDAALRARHLMISSLAPTKRARRASAEDQASQKSQKSAAGDAATAAAAATPSTNALLQRLLPDNNQILQYIHAVDKLPPIKGETILQALFSLVAQIIPLSQSMTATAVAVLSLPWMATDADILQSFKRHTRSLPLLKELYPLTKIVKNACTSSSLLRECTLKPLASLPRPPQFSEWRRRIFEKALTLTPSRNAPSMESVSIVKSALDSLASFTSSVEPGYYEKTLALVIELIDMEELDRSPVHVEHVVRAVADSLCAIDGVSRKMNEGTGEYRCTACEKLQRDLVPTAKTVSVPKDFVKLMVKVFSDDSVKTNTIENRIDAYSILFAMLCHVQDAVKRFEEVIIASLALINDKDEDIRKDYAYAFKVIVSMNPSQKLIQAIMDAFEINDDEVHSQEQEQRIFESSAPFLAHCASESHDVKFRQWSRERMYARALQLPSSTLLTQFAHDLHISEAKKDPEIGADPKRFFVRQTRTLTRMLSSELLSTVVDWWKDRGEYKEDEWIKEVTQDCDYVLHTAARIWGFDSIQSLLRSCASHLVAECIVVEHSVHGAATMVIERVRVHLDRERRSLIEECVPSIVERIIKASTASQSAAKLAKEYCGASMRDLLNARRYHCTFFVLRMMAENEEKALQLLLTINRLEKKDDATLTNVLKIRCEYLGYLLSLRRSLLEDESYDLRGKILKSIRVIITMLEESFLDEIASKLMMVLRAATAVGEEAVEVWTAFVEKLGNGILVSLLPQILIAVQPLLRFESSSGLLKTIFEQRDALKNEQSASFERAVMVLLGGEGSFEDDDGSMRIRKYLSRRRVTPATSEDVILGCARMLHEEGETVGRVVLRRLVSTLDGRPLRDDLAAAVMPALLHTIRVCADADVRLAAAKCIGLVGAVDPGRLGLSLEAQRREGKGVEMGGGGVKKILFVNSSNKEFFVDLLTRAWRVYASLTDADMIDIASFAIQSLLSKLVGPNDENGVFKRLPEECKRDIGPFLKTSLTNNQELKANDVKGKCLVNEVGTFPDWLLQNFLVGVKEIKNSELHDIFKALKWLVYTRDTAFARHLLPHLIIIMLMERREIMLEHYGREMIEVLRRTIDPQSANWTRLAAHVVFSIVDTLERYAISKSEASRKDADHKKVIDLIKRVCSEKLADGSLLVVVAAEKCQCLLRALRWCEQFAIGGGVTEYAHASESAEFDRAPFYDLERLYMQLNEVDGVAGAFATISKSTAPTADERILDLEANGDYTEALPLYAYSGEQKELKLLECLLRLNQPQLALSRAAMEQRGSVRDASTSRAIEAAQLEAAWHLRDWGRLDEMIKKRDPLSSGETGWGAACASIMSTIHHRKENQITVKTDRARSNLVERLTALTIEDSDTYAQSYKYIAQLHMLAEIDDAKVQLFNDSQVACKEQVDEIMKYWEDRSESVAQCASSIEPMLRVRRELLRAAGGDIGESTKDGVCGLLLQSCRLARQAGHLQIAWTFLVEAKALETCHQAVGMEEARFEFQKGNQSEAIGLLSRLLNVRFSKMHEIFSVFSNQSPVGSQAVLATQTNAAARSKLSVEELKINAKSLVAQQRKEERAAYAEVQLLRTEYMLKAGASAPEDLYKTYLGLKKLEVQSEDLHYRVAVFIDSLLNMAEIRSELIPNILDSYGQVIKCGRSHLFHAVPRMLTIWLDVTQKWAEEACTYAPTSSDREKRVKEIRALNQTMRGIIESLPLSVFFPSFPQLISRILHPDQSVFEELMNVLAKLIVAFPHQCLWQAIAVYRDAPDPMQDKHSEKMIKCKQVFERAKMLDKKKTLDDLIDQYDYFARQLINIAESDKVRSDPERLISKHFKHLHNFFKFNKLETMLLLGSKTRKLVGVRSIKPKIMMPMTEMLEQSISEKEDAKASTFSQFNVVDSPLSAVRESPIVEAVFIQDIVDEFVVMSSMMAPRKISLRGSDGKLYSLLCKKDDELRKDARLMSFCKMMNCLMRRTPEARRRQLAVRTFSAIPLQSGGGIIEWVPNLNTFKQTLKPLFIEYQVKNLQRIDYNDKWPIDQKLKMMRDHFYKVYPQVAAEWQRRAFSDPCSWHTARLLFTRSCAVMSMIGFVCGLGDRHADNILIDQTDGGIMHVDFNILFNRGEKLGVPEIVPFRLTRNLVDGFGPTGVEGTWKKSAEATLEVMRANAETLLTVMQAFIYDPLCEFGEGRAQQNKTGQRKMTEQKSSKPSVNEVLEMIKYRLEGHIVTPLTLKKHSLTKKMSVNGQVTKLYELATDETKLCQMFSGWSPYL
ncbi:atl-1 [Pristionchus pacificus]|nr:atl-1 [Pristionchus pacificus]